MLLMFALFTSYILQQKKIQAVHETVLSIFAGVFVQPSRADVGRNAVPLRFITKADGRIQACLSG